MTTVEEQPAPRPGAKRRPQGVLQRAYAFLVSPRLAIAVLVAVLACCLVGVTIFRGARAGEVIFATLWFNGLLVLLALSAGAAFFSRIWKRKLTLVSVGMILFHLSFMAMLGGIVYNSLFFFEGVLRLTEGETLPNGEPSSYDRVAQGRFFTYARLPGETTLVKMHSNYQVDGSNKRAAYEIAIRDGARKTRGIIYVTEFLDFEGVRYFCLKEGYSILLIMADRDGRELAGAHIPLQSYRLPGDRYQYATGSAEGPGPFPFPPPPETPRAAIQLGFTPGQAEREGQVGLQVHLLDPGRFMGTERKGVVPVGGELDAGAFLLSPREIHYWVGMNVRYDPGLVIVLTSLCFGLGGMVITFAGRLRQGGPRQRAA